MERYRIGPDAAVYFVTFTIVDWLPVFVNERTCRIVTDSFKFCHEQKGLRINAYVIMPTHLHAIAFHATYRSEPLQSALNEFRKFTGRELSDDVSRWGPACFATAMRDASATDRERRCWQPSRHPEGIESERFWQQKLDYLHDNPCRKGLVRRAEHWRFSSALHYLSDGREMCDVPISKIAW